MVDRFRFKYDEVGYIGDGAGPPLPLHPRRTGRPTLLTPGEYDEAAPAWSPDGRSIAFLSRRRPEYDRTDNWDIYVVAATAGAGAPAAHHVRGGGHAIPSGAAGRRAGVPDGKLIAYVQGGKPELLYYGGQKVAVVPVDGGPARVLTGVARPERPLAHLLAGRRLGPLPAGGRPGLPPRAGARGRRRGRAPGGGQAGARGSLASAGTAGSRVTSSTPDRPTEVFAVEGRELRKLSAQNDAWLAAGAPGSAGGDLLQEPRRHHDQRLHAQAAGLSRRARATPRILRIHGGPVWQYYHDFANLDWQVLAAQRLRRARRESAGQLRAGREVRHRHLRGLGREGRRRRAGGGGPRGRAPASPIPSGWASAGGATAGS